MFALNVLILSFLYFSTAGEEQNLKVMYIMIIKSFCIVND